MRARRRGFPSSSVGCRRDRPEWRLLRFLAGALLRGLEELQRRAGHDRGNGVLIHELGVSVAAEKHAKIVEPGDNALQLDTIDEEDRERRLVLADVVEKGVLQVLGAISHFLALSAFRVEGVG